jgi:hypothetical protein
MSRNARTLLDNILTAIMQKGVIYGAGRNQLLDKFVEGYLPTLYEDAVLSYEFKGLMKAINDSKLVKPTKRGQEEEYIAIAHLRPLKDKIWSVPERPQTQFSFSNRVSWSEVYEYITSAFLLEDFLEFDLIKLSEIAKTTSLEDVKDACRKIEDPGKKVIPYLYRVIKNEAVVTAEQIKVIHANDNKNSSIISEMMSIASSKSAPVGYDPNWADDVKMTLAMMEAMKKDQDGT